MKRQPTLTRIRSFEPPPRTPPNLFMVIDYLLVFCYLEETGWRLEISFAFGGSVGLRLKLSRGVTDCKIKC